MATCGHCGQTGQTVAHVRTCGQAGAVATRELPELAPGNVVTLANADGYWVVNRRVDLSQYVVEQSLPGDRRGATAFMHASEVELVFANVQAAVDYELALRTEATLRSNREILHGDPNYCRGCEKGWAGAKWHRTDCPRIQAVVDAARAEGQRVVGTDDMREVAGRVSDNVWAPVNELRNAIKPHLHRKVRNAIMGHYAVREEAVVKFYRVKLVTGGNWAGKVFVEAQASDDFYPVRNPATLAQVLGAIMVDPHAAEELYGQELGQCYRCNRTLTDETSRALGIGPECRSKL
jgi:hypothetical protein